MQKIDNNEAYSHEIKSFIECFGRFKTERIVLYGIGRYTATILSSLNGEFNFVGLLDRDSENLGKIISGVEVIDLNKIEQVADVIIINTQESYWNIIYQRIKGVKIPVYFKNGELAIENDNAMADNNPYWDMDVDTLYKLIMDYEVVSFDVFDTLISRKVLLPKDVFSVLEKRARKRGILKPINETRQLLNAVCIDRMYSIDDIYDEMEKILDLTEDDRKWLQNEERIIEEEVCCPRYSMIDLFNRVSATMECYLVSDMYYSKEYIIKLLKVAGVDRIEESNVFISCEVGKSKKNGDIWREYKSIVGNRKAIHVGDNPEGDGIRPKEYGIDSFLIYSPMKLWENSSISQLLPYITSKESLCAGLICLRLFNDPFSLGKNKGRVYLHEYEEIGYVLFGAFIYTFLMWINQYHKKEGERLFFFARDGYWLEDNYKYMRKIFKQSNESSDQFFDADYLAISRRIVLISRIDDPDGWEEILKFPFVGDFSYFTKIRLGMDLPDDDKHYGVQITLPSDYEAVSSWLDPYKEIIVKNLIEEKNRYLKYLERKNITESDYFVDLWFNGNNQYYLSKVLKKHLMGFYVVANMEDSNKCKENNTLFSCFQDKEDLLADNNSIYKMAAFVEAVLTAPYGMILSVDETGKMICGPKMENQKRWTARERIDKGIKEYIKDYIRLNGDTLTRDFVDKLWEEMKNNHLNLVDSMKTEFYCDNALIKKQEYSVFL